jgi:hypothetical protein
VPVVVFESDAVMVSAVVADMLSVPALVEFESVTETDAVPVVESELEPLAESAPGRTSVASAPQAPPRSTSASELSLDRMRIS